MPKQIKLKIRNRPGLEDGEYIFRSGVTILDQNLSYTSRLRILESIGMLNPHNFWNLLPHDQLTNEVGPCLITADLIPFSRKEYSFPVDILTEDYGTELMQAEERNKDLKIYSEGSMYRELRKNANKFFKKYGETNTDVVKANILDLMNKFAEKAGVNKNLEIVNYEVREDKIFFNIYDSSVDQYEDIAIDQNADLSLFFIFSYVIITKEDCILLSTDAASEKFFLNGIDKQCFYTLEKNEIIIVLA